MDFFTNRGEEKFEARNITIVVGETEFIISLNNFNQLVVNKQHFGADDSAIHILPSTSNEIRIQ